MSFRRTPQEVLALAAGIQATEPLDAPLRLCLHIDDEDLEAELSVDGKDLSVCALGYVDQITATLSFKEPP